MSDIAELHRNGIPFFAVVDENGTAEGGTLTISQLRSRGMEPICEVDATGVASGGTTTQTLRQRGIQFFCPVDEDGLAAGGVTMATLRQRAIPPVCLVGVDGVAQDGSATKAALDRNGIQFFCPLDENGDEITGTPPVPGGVGSPMGLLLALTYPT